MAPRIAASRAAHFTWLERRWQTITRCSGSRAVRVSNPKEFHRDDPKTQSSTRAWSLSGSAAYAVAEAAGWHGSLSVRLDKGEGRGFYGVIAAATVGGVLLCFAPTDPVKELFWSAVINGVIAVPIMVVMMLLASRRATMGEHVIGRRSRWKGWIATALMAANVCAMMLAF